VIRPTGARYYVDSEALTWSQAQAKCVARGLNLVSISGFNVAMDLKGLASEAQISVFWTGATDSQVEGTWRWPDGSSVAYTRLWAEGEPNNANNEDCMEVQASNSKANDISCDARKSFICGGKEAGGCRLLACTE
jgi:hypothetical protein